MSTAREGRLVDRRRWSIVIYALFPIAWIVSLSFKAPGDIANGQFLPTDVVLGELRADPHRRRAATCSCRRCATRSASA